MRDEQVAAAALLGASALHLGFQAAVTVLVYPALARTGAAQWAEAHATHSRRITPLVGACYGALVLTGGWVLVTGPREPAALLAVGAGLVAIATTAAVAAPVHGRLGSEGPRPELLARLLRADRVRLVAAVTGFVAAVLTVVRG